MKTNNITCTEQIIDDGIIAFKVQNTEYRIVDHSTEQGTMYLVHRAEEPSRAVWVDNIVQARQVCKQDYMARG